MNNRQLAQVGLGLLGVWALLAAVSTFMQIAAVIGASAARLALAEVLPVALMLGLSYVLLFHNAKVAMAIFPDVDGAPDQATHDISRTLVALTGVFFLIQAAPSALNGLLNLFTVSEVDPTLRGGMLRRLVGSFIPIAAGIYLIARPGRLLDYLQRPLPEVAAMSHDA